MIETDEIVFRNNITFNLQSFSVKKYIRKKHFILLLISLMSNLECLKSQSYSMSNGTITDCSGFFYDPGGSNSNYGNNASYIQTICSDNGQSLQFIFSQFNTELTYDVLSVYDGASTSAPLIGTLTGNNITDTIYSTGTCITFKFTSDFSVDYTGWVAEFHCFGVVMGNGSNNLCSGFFYDSGGLNNAYNLNENFTKTICSGSNSPLLISFTQFNIENGYDFLKVYDGSSISSPLIGSYTGTNSPGLLISSGNCLTFNFTSDGIINMNGWEAEIDCGYAMNSLSETTCEGSFFDSGGPNGNYTSSSNLTKTFTSATGEPLIMNFTQFDLENNYDFLYLYDGNSINSPLIGTFTGTNSPGLIVSTGVSLTARFTSDITLEKAGWKAELSCNIPDLELVKVESATSFCGLSNEDVTFKIRNNSFAPISNIPVSFSVNNGNWINEVCGATILPGDTAAFVFTNKANLSIIGNNTILGAVDLSTDLNSSNDSAQYSISTYNAFDINTANYSMGFETSEINLLQNWTFQDKNSDGFSWSVANSDNYAGNACLIKSSSIVNDDDWAITGCLQLTGGITYHLEYYSKNFELLQPCFLEVYCGNDPTSFGTNELIFQNPIPSDTSYQYTSVFFTPANSAVYYIAFHGYESSGTSSLRLDNINLSISPNGIGQTQLNRDITIFPNPTSGTFHLHSPISKGKIVIHNVLGEAVFSMENIDQEKVELDLSQLKNGTYILTIFDEKLKFTKTISIVK